MTDTKEIIDMDQLDHTTCRAWGFSQDFCVTCGMCASSCPVSGIDGFDPRMLVRMVSLGLVEELVDSRWPWICTMCGKCENVCPMQIDIADLIRKIRSKREREKVPGILHKGLVAALETGNNLRLPKEDFMFIIEDVAEEVAEEPGFEGFEAPIDKKGANWKIFHAAKEDWTVTSENWEGTNWGYFTGDDDAMKVMIGRIVDQMKRLEIKNLLCPE